MVKQHTCCTVKGSGPQTSRNGRCSHFAVHLRQICHAHVCVCARTHILICQNTSQSTADAQTCNTVGCFQPRPASCTEVHAHLPRFTSQRGSCWLHSWVGVCVALPLPHMSGCSVAPEGKVTAGDTELAAKPLGQRDARPHWVESLLASRVILLWGGQPLEAGRGKGQLLPGASGRHQRC